MISLDLTHLKFYKILTSRIPTEPLAAVLSGLMVSLTGDAHEFLGFVRNKFPAYTGHDIQHSWRILKRVEDIMNEDALNGLSSLEIFCLVIATAFHDVGMISTEGEPEDIRKIHHFKSEKFLNDFLMFRLSSISEYLSRLVKCIGFIARSHGTSWEDMTSDDCFKRPERVLEQTIRTNLLAILLRVGDLLDLDSDRSCDGLRRFATGYFQDSYSNEHHERHKHVSHFYCDSSSVEIEVEAMTKTEYTIWSEWFGYLKQDILHANTYVLVGNLKLYQLPKTLTTITVPPNATYELWPLRFEIDEKGKIWDVISQSIYTGKFDFMRELVQNSIDACLRWIYIHPNSEVQGCNPKSWSLAQYQPTITIRISELQGTIEVIDNGIGMDKESLKNFLFNVASSGYQNAVANRPLKFPSIARFGIGFISCLVRANKIVIKTKSRENNVPLGREVLLKTEALDAYSETVDCPVGTSIKLYLKDQYAFTKIQDYFRQNFNSPAVRIFLINEDIIGSSNQLPIEDLRQMPLMEVLAIRTEPLSKNLIDALDTESSPRSKIYLSDYFYEIPTVKEFNFKVLKKTYFLDLNRDLRIKKVRHHALNQFPIANILMIPVLLIDDDIGIEWYSIHAFVLKNGEVCNTIVSASIEEQRGFKTILTQDELEEQFLSADEDQRNQIIHLMESALPESDFRVPSSMLPFDDESGRLTSKLDAICVSEIYELSGPRYDLFENIAVEKTRFYSTGKDLTKTERQLMELNEMVEKNLTNKIYQDGILLPIPANTIVPIGTVHAVCNLFGNARLDLNVTRNTINESSVLIKNWMSSVGIKIQKAVFSEIKNVFDSNGVHYDAEELIKIEKITGSTAIYEYSSAILKKLIAKW